MIKDFKVTNYRSIKDVWLRLQPINVIVGPNGVGKSNLYRALYLVSAAATGQLSMALATEGSVGAALWAGPHGKKSKAEIEVSVTVDEFQYNLACGPMRCDGGCHQRPEVFKSDAEIKSEEVYRWQKGHKHSLLKRGRVYVEARNASGKMVDYTKQVRDNESVLTGLRDPFAFPDLFALREEFLNWRFFHDFRTDVDSPLRKPRISVMTPLMSHDGGDFVAALATIQAVDEDALTESLELAFPGSKLDFEQTPSGLDLLMLGPNMRRPLKVHELSDGTLQYLCLIAALLSARPPSLLALNEPETSVHPRLYEHLARLIVASSERSQLWITTHSTELADYILELSGCIPIELEKVEGETRMVGVGLGGYREDDEEEPEQAE
ncbi:MAG TPA: AAA family ATPase [Planktothrix sp.]|jgi:predicted ATPase